MGMSKAPPPLIPPTIWIPHDVPEQIQIHQKQKAEEDNDQSTVWKRINSDGNDRIIEDP